MPGFVTALSDENQQTDFQSGGRSLPGNAALILPGLRLLDWPVKCPLYARAIDIFRGCAFGAATTFTFNHCFNCCLQEPRCKSQIREGNSSV
jgi:hypothetical protein